MHAEELVDFKSKRTRDKPRCIFRQREDRWGFETGLIAQKHIDGRCFREITGKNSAKEEEEGTSEWPYQSQR